MKLTREQLAKWDGQAGNDFHFDVYIFINWHEKTLIKRIPIKGGDIIEFALRYIPEHETIEGKYCRYSRATGKHIPVLTIHRLIPFKTEGMYQSINIKGPVYVGDPETSKKYSVLCSLSKTINTDTYMESIKT